MNKLKEKNVLPLMLSSSLMLQRVPCYNTTSKDDTDVTTVATRVKALEDSMNEYMKQQTNQMNNLLNTVKKHSPSFNTGAQMGNGAGYIQQQRARMESLSKKHKLDDDESEVFPPLQPSGRRVSQPIHPSGRSSQPTLPPGPPAGISAPPQANPTQSYAKTAQTAQTAQSTRQNNNQQGPQPPFRPRRQSTLLFGQAKIIRLNYPLPMLTW